MLPCLLLATPADPSPPHVYIESVTVTPSHLSTALFHAAIQRTGTLDSINATTHAWHNPTNRQAVSILYSPLTPTEWCTWLPTVTEPEVVRAMQSLDILTIGNFFADGRGRDWDDLVANKPEPDVRSESCWVRSCWNPRKLCPSP